MHTLGTKSWYRIIDVNFNRAKEGLRVCEDICRFIVNSPAHTRTYKTIRHALSTIILRAYKHTCITARDSASDVGRHIAGRELSRGSTADIFYANAQRVKESVRVLEEFTKLVNKRQALQLKHLRYQLYEVERRVAQKL